jgi:nucleotide-binding universal stress UspA family protein
MKPYRRILFATDLSRSSMPGFREAVELARESMAELLITYAYQPPNLIQAQSIAPSVYDEWNRNLRTEIEARIEPLVAEARERGLRARTLLVEGSPDEAIAEAAAQNQVDLIIMGSHGRTGISRLIQGSVSAHVIATAKCPVMTVPIA